MPYLIRKTKDLIIRPLDKGDYEVWRSYFHTYGDAQNQWDSVARSPDELSKTDFNKQLKKMERLLQNDESVNLYSFEKKSGMMIGGLSLMSIVRSLTQTCFIGYNVHHNFWGKGYGKQSVEALIDIAFRDVKLHRVEAGIEPYNRRSIMLARSLGLRKEGLKKRAVFLRGEWRDLIIYSATCEEFGIKWKKTKLPRRL